MKRGKDEEKLMGPMFPRVHVNDTDKGGPRAPPRNKMALYEQLSIPSQRFNHSVLPLNQNNTAANFVPPSSQGFANDRGMFFSHQLPPRHQSEKQYSQYSDLSTPLTQAEQTKKSDEDDFRVPIFIHPIPNQECGRNTNNMGTEKFSPSNPSFSICQSKFQKAKKTGAVESNMVQEEKIQKEENSRDFTADRFKAISNSSTMEKVESLTKQTHSSVCREPRDCPANSIDRLNTHDSIADLDERTSPTPGRALPSEDQNNFRDPGKDTESREDGSCRSLQTKKLERGDSVSEASVVDSISRLETTPDDVVGIIGQKRFWKARRAIAHQQKLFAVQLFELHRLIKVQRLIAASPHLLLEDSPYLGKRTNSLPVKKIPLNYPVKSIPNIPKQKGEPEKPTHKEISAENTVGKPSFSSVQNDALPSSCRPLTGNSPAPSVNGNNPNPRPWCFNQPNGHQWLIPVMSPSEGLVYKPYPGPTFAGPACSGCGPPGSNPTMGSFLPPVYGVPAPHSQYQFPAFPPASPHGYFPAYGMPIMNGATFSGTSVDVPTIPFTVGEAKVESHKKQASPEVLTNMHMSEDVEVQASTGSSPIERREDGGPGDAMEGRNVLRLFPTSPATDNPSSGPQLPELERPTQVIKVVPHNARSATESAARIFQSIQEERKQYDLV